VPEYAMVWVFSVLGTLFVGGAILASKLVAARSEDTDKKLAPYECSMESIGSARIQFKVGYYLFALIFMVFDVEALFLFPCVTIFRDVAEGRVDAVSTAMFFGEIGLFVFILFVGLIYAWKRKVLEWE
jgi:NADH:ubiquinone oxidoreductase subunit 3 (subunit A)